jgi:hypothetical protein
MNRSLESNSIKKTLDGPCLAADISSLAETDDTPYKEALHLPERTPSWYEVEEASKRLGAYLAEDEEGNGLRPIEKAKLRIPPTRKFVRYSVVKGFHSQPKVDAKIEGYGWSVAHNMQLTIQALGACLGINDVIVSWDGLKLLTNGFPYINGESFDTPFEAEIYDQEMEEAADNHARPEMITVPIRTIEPYRYAYPELPAEEQMRILDHHITGRPELAQGRLASITELKTARERQIHGLARQNGNQRELTPTVVANGMVNLVTRHVTIDLNGLRDYCA